MATGDYTETQDGSTSISSAQGGNWWSSEFSNAGSDAIFLPPSRKTGNLTTGAYNRYRDGLRRLVDHRIIRRRLHQRRMGKPAAMALPLRSPKTANWISATMPWTWMPLPPNAWTVASFTDQGMTGDDNPTGDTSFTSEQTGNTLSGDYALHVESSFQRRRYVQRRR